MSEWVITMKVTFLNDTQQSICINPASKENGIAGEFHEIQHAEERVFILSDDSFLHLTIEENKDDILTLTLKASENNVRVTNLTSRTISIHPATFIHGCHGIDMPISPKEDAIFLLPEGTFPWVKMWDYKERGGLQILVSPEKEKGHEEEN